MDVTIIGVLLGVTVIGCGGTASTKRRVAGATGSSREGNLSKEVPGRAFEHCLV